MFRITERTATNSSPPVYLSATSLFSPFLSSLRATYFSVFVSSTASFNRILDYTVAEEEKLLNIFRVGEEAC